MKKSKLPADPSQRAFAILKAATDSEPLDPMREAARALGRRGGLIGGKKRAENLTPEKLSEIGKMGAAKRWKKKP